MVHLFVTIALLLTSSSEAMFDKGILDKLVSDNFINKLKYAEVLAAARAQEKTSAKALRNFQKKELQRLKQVDASSDIAPIDDDIPKDFSIALMEHFLSAAAAATDITLFAILNPSASVFSARTNMMTSLRDSLLDFEFLPTVMENQCTTTKCIDELLQYSLGVVSFASMLGRNKFADMNANTLYVRTFLTHAVVELKNSDDHYHNLAALYLHKFLSVLDNTLTHAQFWQELNIDVKNDEIPFSRAEIYSTAFWLNDLHAAALHAFPHSSIKIPRQMEFGKTIVLTQCSLKGESLLAGHLHGRCTDGIGTVYKVNVYSFGASVGLRMIYSDIVIKQRHISHPEGTWTGVTAEFVFGYARFKNRKNKSNITQKTLTPGLNCNLDVAQIIIRRE